MLSDKKYLYIEVAPEQFLINNIKYYFIYIWKIPKNQFPKKALNFPSTANMNYPDIIMVTFLYQE